jgi:hypothetical protein
MSHWTRLDFTTAVAGVLAAAVFFPMFFGGLSGFWESLTEGGGSKMLSVGQCKVIFWLFLAAGVAWSLH